MLSQPPSSPLEDPNLSTGKRALLHLDKAGWGNLSDRLIAGACHELNGRSSALYGLAELTRAGDEADFVSEALGKEALRLQDLVRALRTISARGLTDPQPMALQERIEDLLTLFRALPGAEMLSIEERFDPNAPAVMAPWAPLARGVLLILSHLGSLALRGGGMGAISVSLEGRPEGPALVMSVAPVEGLGTTDPAAEELIHDSWSWPMGAQTAMEMIGCFFLDSPVEDSQGVTKKEEAGAPPRVVVRLPPLSRAS